MNTNELIEHINREVRTGDDIDCMAGELVGFIVAHMNDNCFSLQHLVPQHLNDVTEVTTLSNEQMNTIIDIGHKATKTIINELLNLLERN